MLIVIPSFLFQLRINGLAGALWMEATDVESVGVGNQNGLADMKQINHGKKAAMMAGMISLSLLPSVSNAVTYTCTDLIYGGVLMSINTGGHVSPTLVGELKLVTSDPGYSSKLYTYSTDVGVMLAGTANYVPTPASSAGGVSPAWINGGIENAARLWTGERAFANTAYETAGLQLAIWELLYNTPTTGFLAANFFNPHNGGFYITSDNSDAVISATYAANYLQALSSLPGCPDNISVLTAMGNNCPAGYQGLLFEGGSSRNDAPDATSTLSLLGIAAATLAIAAFSPKK